MKINEQTQDISDLMQNFFKKNFFLNNYRTKKKKMQYTYVNICTFFWGGGRVGCCRVSHNIKI